MFQIKGDVPPRKRRALITTARFTLNSVKEQRMVRIHQRVAQLVDSPKKNRKLQKPQDEAIISHRRPGPTADHAGSL